ncbi:MAG: S8 family serine peptidase, partial [Ramlibacter sp.]|nr:S8 family serine peptidase [Ramlibacter sp.]
RVTARGDALGHGTAVAQILLSQAPFAQLASAQVFTDQRHADAACLAAAIHWCIEQQVRVINLSWGLALDHGALRAACRAAAACGTIVVAACPARGGGVYPAAYPEVLAVSGDARCAGGGWSVIEPHRLYGEAALAADGLTPGGGSYAAARLSGRAAGFLALRPGAGAGDFRQWLEAGAAFRGRERRRAVELA